MDADYARGFAENWAAALNARELDRVLAHYADTVVVRSPGIAAAGHPGGTLHGREALRAYWLDGLSRAPDTRFQIRDVYLGLDTLVVNYLNQKGQAVSEVLTFDQGLVVSAIAAYAP
jgi:hypothetical protein